MDSQVLTLECLWTNTDVEYASVQQEHDMMVYGVSSNCQFESCEELNLHEHFQIFEKFSQFTQKSLLALTSALLASINLHPSSSYCICSKHQKPCM